MSIQLKMIRSGALKLFRQQSEHRTIGFNITRACNYSCSYCVQDQQDFQVSHLPLEFITRVIDICASHGKVTALNFSGGEPTVHPRFYDILSYARASGEWNLQCTTNGSGGKEYFKKARSIDNRLRHGVSIHFDHYHTSNIKEIIEELALFADRQTLLILFMPGKIEEVNNIIEFAKSSKNIDVNITAVFSSAEGRLFYNYTREEITFIENIMGEKLSSNFADFIDERGIIYRIFGSPNSFLQDNNIFRHFFGMKCTTCARTNKIRSGKIWPMLCDFNVFEERIEVDSLFKYNKLKCSTFFCACNGHTLPPKFSELKWAPVFMGGDHNLHVDVVNPRILDKSDIEIRFDGKRPLFFLKEQAFQ